MIFERTIIYSYHNPDSIYFRMVVDALAQVHMRTHRDRFHPGEPGSKRAVQWQYIPKSLRVQSSQQQNIYGFYIRNRSSDLENVLCV